MSSEYNVPKLISWPLIGFIGLNLSLLLNLFWIRSISLLNHIQIFLTTFFDINLTYASLYLMFQLFPRYQLENLQFLFDFFDHSFQIIQNFFDSIRLDCFFFTFFITGTIIGMEY